MSNQNPSQITSLIASTYSNMRDAFKGFSPRVQQKDMIKRVSGLISKKHIGLIEAPTGTGKSLGYLIPGIISAAMEDRILVISTATASLQDQLAKRDIPNALKAISAAKSEDGATVIGVKVAIAKGRERHVCNVNLNAAASTADLFNETTPEVRSFVETKRLFDRGLWDGTRDTLEVSMPQSQWRKIANNAATCTGRNCSQFKDCPYYMAQEEIKTARVIVTNHDYLLACISNIPNSPLANPDSIYVFDEAHHLPDKIIAAFAQSIQFSAFWDKDMVDLLPWLGEDRELVDLAQERVTGLWRACERSVETMLGDGRQHRFTLGEPPPQFVSLMRDLGGDITGLRDQLDRAKESFRKRETSTRIAGVATLAEMMFGKVLGQINDALACIEDFTSEENRARWLARERFGVEVRTSPFDASGFAKTRLWPVAKNSILTSATLAPLGQFDPVLRSLGLGHGTPTLRLSSPFDYSRAALRVPKMVLDGSDPAHAKRVRAYLGDLISDQKNAGVLVYFTSRQMMQDCYDALEPLVRKSVLLQGDLQTSAIIAEHCNRIDAGARSVIFGLDSFGEGIDLPGKYLTRVVITRLPFAHMDDPITATHGEHLEEKGLNPFTMILLPKAGQKLAQICGRLMRREDDHGDVLVLDKRLVTKRYGRQLVNGTSFTTVQHS
ncbi:MAG: DEAD/DEAH box helicase family protein [Limnohabitans sp.]|uniref:helicase C-terminal domain-containing protein n=1 Tax=Limnohabitans sp. TaxID=1907725 RepID=UPI0025E949CA|nr:helicase C-terminal domain-containing protein [Limnohabitans sp.]MCO4087451.1 DEAD/DEAH box helicase family protein [Limnohabitans sp.]